MVRFFKKSKKSDFIKTIEDLKHDIEQNQTLSINILYHSRDDFIEKLFESIMKEKSISIIEEHPK
ncbi:MAG: hypothetical protein GF353_28490 [Candidatus Lokiarchaeota archaeon]|nr:hypothetical protein [Candidatus Lokiarchaeota archaeon]